MNLGGTRLKAIAALFLKLGATSFGGPAAHIAMMEEEVVKRRKWLTHESFLDLVGVTNLIPGPNSTEMAMHIGFVKAGWRGLFTAGLCFIVPAVVITLVFAALYVHFGTKPELEPFVRGIRAAILAVMLTAFYRLSKPLAKNRLAATLALLVLILNLLGVGEIYLLLSSGVAGILWASRTAWAKRIHSFLIVSPVSSVLFASSATLTAPVSLVGLGLFFLKIGSVLYGSGYVLVAYLQGGLVESRHWLTQSQLLDAIAIGQFTPGPVLSTATFIGYLLFGISGAAVATAGIFAPSFVFVSATGPLISKLKSSSIIRGFLDGVNGASLGLMLAVTVSLAVATMSSVSGWIIFALAAGVMILWNPNAAWIVAAGGLLGWLFAAALLR